MGSIIVADSSKATSFNAPIFSTGISYMSLSHQQVGANDIPQKNQITCTCKYYYDNDYFYALVGSEFIRGLNYGGAYYFSTALGFDAYQGKLQSGFRVINSSGKIVESYYSTPTNNDGERENSFYNSIGMSQKCYYINSNNTEIPTGDTNLNCNTTIQENSNDRYFIKLERTSEDRYIKPFSIWIPGDESLGGCGSFTDNGAPTWVTTQDGISNYIKIPAKTSITPSTFPIFYGNARIKRVCLGNKDIKAIYYGSKQIY